MADKIPSTISNLARPVVFNGYIDSWKAMSWSPEVLAAALNDSKLCIRIGSKNGDVQFEASCAYEEASIKNLVDWVNNDISVSSNNPLSKYSASDHWAYADYKYFPSIFADKPEQLNAVDWTTFGFTEPHSEKSTFWMGTAGAFTPCHYDTFGCNLVAQIYGQKKWTLFQPEDTVYLYPTRVPYEESSIFSSINFNNVDLEKYPLIRLAAPYVVTLQPGQVLYVPRHWWHLVECLDTSVSVNFWIDMPSLDNEERIREAITRIIMSAMMSEVPDEQWVNPTESVCSHSENMDLLYAALCQVQDTELSSREHDVAKEVLKGHQKTKHGYGDDELASVQCMKKQKCSGDGEKFEESSVESSKPKQSVDVFPSSDNNESGVPQNFHRSDIFVPSMSIESFLAEKCQTFHSSQLTVDKSSDTERKDNGEMTKKLANAIVHPDVIKQITKIFKSSLKL